MVLMSVGDQDRGNLATADALQNMFLMDAIQRPGVDDHNRAVSVVEKPRVGPGAGERTGVVGEQTLNSHAGLR
jgi:hypothetical protein